MGAKARGSKVNIVVIAAQTSGSNILTKILPLIFVLCSEAFLWHFCGSIIEWLLQDILNHICSLCFDFIYLQYGHYFCRKEWEKGHGGLEHEEGNVEWKQVPFFTNVNEDTQLSGVVKQCLRLGQCPEFSL